MKQKTPAEYVNPYIGTVGHFLTATRPTVMRPHGIAQIYPTVSPQMNDYYFADKITSFPMDALEIMFSGADTDRFCRAASHFEVSSVRSHPYSYSVYLEDNGVTVEGTTTMRGYVYRTKGAKKIFLHSEQLLTLRVKSDCILLTVLGGTKKTGTYKVYIKVRLSCPFITENLSDGIVLCDLADTCEIYAAVSYVSPEKADQIDRHELSGKNFDAVARESMQVWNNLLGKVKISGGSEEMKTVYYTALYRSFGKMNDFSEYGKYYSGYDNAVHDGEFYCNDQLWDSFRCMHPLQLLLEPEKHKKMLDSYVQMYRQSGAMPAFPFIGGDRPIMFGFHAAALFADALAKGIDFDCKTAYEGLYRSATQTTMCPWVADVPATELDRCYYEKGFFPGLEIGQPEWVSEVHAKEKRQCVAVTLEHAYDDWCIAQLAHHLGKMDDYEMFMKRSQNYRNVYNTEIGFMAPKNENGEWIKDFDPMVSGGQGGRDYFAECNAYIFNYSVWQDLNGLIELMDGKERFCERLDELFVCMPRSKFDFLKQFPDMSGLMGMFCMGNEPAFHIPYLYNYAGKPWMTQRRLRTIMELWFTNSPLGICGDDDCGAMSSWLAFSALGFYPVCPGKSEYALSSPMFDKIEIAVSGGLFTIRAKGASEGKRYIKSAKLNGRDYNKAFLSHADLIAGGKLVLEMDDRPNPAWGLDK